MSDTKALATVDREKVTKQLQTLVQEYGPAAVAKLDHFSRAFRLADAVQRFRFVVREAMPLIRPLQGSALGFKTDKDTNRDGSPGPGYPDSVIEEAATEALLRGVMLDGNEWNIIGGRCYITKAGMARIVGNLPGLTDLTLDPSIPIFSGVGAVVDFTARWKMDGQPQTLTRKVPVKCQPGAVDAAIGKATRKMLAAIYEKVTGSSIGEGEVDEALPPPPALKQPAQPSAIDRHAELIRSTKTEQELRATWDAVPANLKAALVGVKDEQKVRLAGKQPPQNPTPANGTPAPSVTDLVKLVGRLAEYGEDQPRILNRVCGWFRVADFDEMTPEQRTAAADKLEGEIETAETPIPG